KADADRWYQEQLVFKERLAAGFATHASTTTLEQFAADWLESRKVSGQPASSSQQDHARLRLYILPQFGKRILDTIKTREWDAFLNKLQREKNLSGASANRVRSLLSKLYNDAKRLEAASHNPISIIPKAKESMATMNYFESREEAAKYLATAKSIGSDAAAFAYLALTTGCRVGELCALDYGDIDLKQKRIRVSKIFESVTLEVQKRTKGFTERHLGISEVALGILIEHKRQAEKNSPSDPVLTDEYGHRMSTYSARRVHARILRVSGLKTIRVHDLRHTFASHYVMSGGSLAELQGLLGHTSPMMTLKYAHLAPGFLASKANVVSYEPEETEQSLKLIVSKS
ncbi:MAG: site-specific integrase, partial [Proteobacteria bacterium]